MDSLKQKNLNELREAFLEAQSEYMPYSFTTAHLPINVAEFKKELLRKKKNGISVIIPEIHSQSATPSKKELSDFYRTVFPLCASLGMSVLFNFDTCIESITVEDAMEYDSSLCANILTLHTHRCFEHEELRYDIHSGELMSIVAYDGYQKITDLREFVKDGCLCWDVPRGNWEILEFVCVPDEEAKRVNYLSYNTSLDYISLVTESFGAIAHSEKALSLKGLKYNNLEFVGKNRRMWDKDFNRVFEAKYGFDPAPFYPAIFYDIGPDTARLKAQFFDCRAEMLKGGFAKAIYDFCEEHDILCIGGLTEPKITSCSQLIGDGIMINSYAPSALMNKAYLYGINSVKIAAGAAYTFDKQTVSCDLYEDYKQIDLDIAYRDAMHAISRGANKIILHSPEFEDINAPSLKKILFGEGNTLAFTRFLSKVLALLHGGRHVSDIALLYPIYSLHSSVYFYDYAARGFEYPNTMSTADYMSVINSISMYSGHDLTVIHPDVLNEKCHVHENCIYLDNTINKERFRVLVMPSSNVASVKNLEIVAKFFDKGGKIIATGALPKYAIESNREKNYDQRLAELVEHIFGKEASNDKIMRDYCLNTNINGGMAYMLYHSLTAADGTSMTDSATLSNALSSFDIPFDITLSNTKRYESTGALNAIYPEFEKLGLSNHLPNGGMINHIHKKFGDIDIYYISNTTSDTLSTNIVLRGEMFIEEWNPHTGKTKRLPTSYSKKDYSGVLTGFTEVRTEIPTARSIILIGTPIN